MSFYKTRNVASGDILSYYTSSYDYKTDISLLKRSINETTTRPRFRLHILNPDETVKQSIPSSDIISGGSYNENYQNGQRRSLSITLFNGDGRYTPSINGLWMGSKMSFEMGLELADGETIWFPKGVYVISNINPSHSSGEQTVSVELSDKFALLEGASGTLETSYSIPVGNDIREIIENILGQSMGNGEMIDSKPIIYHSSFEGSKTQATISKETGDNYGSIITDLATQLNAEVFYDASGSLNFVPINDVTEDADKPIIFSFFAESGDIASDSMTFNMSEVINRVIVVGSTVNSEICKGVALNDNISSPICYQRIGYRTASVINDTNIMSSRLAQERAEYELRSKSILQTTVSADIRLNPLLLVNNIVNITDGFFGLENEGFLIQSISCPIDFSGSMSITLSNLKNISFTTGIR